MAKQQTDDATLVTIAHPDGTRIIVTFGQFRREYEGGGYRVVTDEVSGAQATVEPAAGES